MNIARTFHNITQRNGGRNFYRKFRFSSTNRESTEATQPKVQEERYSFEDLKVLERVERRKASIQPFMKNIFASIYDRELLAYPEILNKEETEALDNRVAVLEKVFSDPEKSLQDRKNALNQTKMYAAPVSLTNGGLAMNYTESIRYMETISSDMKLSEEISDHWVGLQVLEKGMKSDDYTKIVNDLTSGERPIALCIKEKISERILQADFRTKAQLDEKGIWRISGEKMCIHNCGYYLVLCLVEGERMKAFLVHPEAEGVSYKDNYVTFRSTPATLVNDITDTSLARTLATSRLHAATLCRNGVKRALHAAADFIRPRVFSGKPLSELSTIRAAIGNAILDIYASESAEYFTAGLQDGYLDPDTELEMAMCRNFMAHHGLNTLVKLLDIPAVEEEEKCNRLLNDVRHLALRGENIDNVNMFIALNGIHHAGKMMAGEIKQMRNPLFHPTFILKKILADRHQEKDDPKLTLFLAEHLHPSLRGPAEHLEYCVLRMRYASETLMARHGVNVASAYTELSRLAQAATEILVMTSVLARASRAYCIGLRNAEMEMKLAACFVEKNKGRVKQLILEIDDGEYLNLDNFFIQFGRKVLDTNSAIVEKPTSRVFW